MARYGITIPFEGVALAHQRDLVASLPDLGYTDVWSAESNGYDAFTPLALASQWAPALRLGTAIAPVYTRGPGTLAMQAATLAAAAPGRFALGVGSSSNVIVERWNALSFDRPYQRVRDTVRFLRSALAGEKVTEDYETFSVQGFKLGAAPAQPPPILVAALRSGMLRLAGREADGAVVNWLSPDDARTVTGIVRDAAEQAGRPEPEVAARIFVAPSDDAETCRGIARFVIAAYLSVPVYRAFHDWLGHGELMAGFHDKWAAGDRKGALAEIPDQVVDDLVVHGPPERCRDRIEQYAASGITTPVIALLPVVSIEDGIKALAPAG